MKDIKVTCQGAATLRLEELTDIQKDLKTLSAKNYEKLNKSILKHGITYPLFVWRDGERNCTLDGNQRVRVLTKMQEDGYVIPPLPVDFIEAADEKEAKEKILVLCSQFGSYTSESVYSFVETGGLNWPEIEPLLDLPQINMDKYNNGWGTPDFQPTNQDEQGRLDQKSPVECPNCGTSFVPK